MRKNPNKSNYHYRVDFDNETYSRFFTIKEIESEYGISNFTIHKLIRQGTTTRKCPNIVKIAKDYQPAFYMVPNMD